MSNLWMQMFLNAVTSGLLYVLMAVGLTLIFGTMKILNFAHGAFYMAGGFAVWYLSVEAGLNFFLAWLLTVAIMGLLGLLAERVLLRPNHDKPLSILVVTIGLALFLEFLALLVFGASDQNIPEFAPGMLTVWGARVSLERVLCAAVGAIAITAVIVFVRRTKPGRAMRAVAQDSSAASLMGVKVSSINSMCFGLGSALAGAAGALLGSLFVINVGIGLTPMIKSFIMIIVGGLGSIPGALAGGLILAFMDSYIGTLMGADLAYALTFALLFIFIILRPRGLFGRE